MKRYIFLMVSMLLLFITWGCSKDHEAPTFSAYEHLSNPTNVQATYQAATDDIDISWSMTDPSGVQRYVIVVSDSSVYNEGNSFERLTDTAATSYTMSTGFIPAAIDSTVRYFWVAALYNDEDVSEFIGPISDDADSTVIYRK